MNVGVFIHVRQRLEDNFGCYLSSISHLFYVLVAYLGFSFLIN